MYNNRDNGFKRILYFALSAIVVVVLVILAVVMINNSGSLTVSGVKELLSQIRVTNPADEFYFSSDNEAVFADMEGGFLTASTSGVQMFNRQGEEIFSETLILSDPAITSQGKYAAVYDIGGTYFSLFDKAGKLWSITSENSIISADVDDSGHVVLCTDESGYRGLVTVYNKNSEALYKWYSGTGYVLGAKMTDSSHFVALTLEAQGSALTELSINSEEQEGSVLVEEQMVIDFMVMPSGRICAIADNGVYMVNMDKQAYELKYAYDGRYLDKYVTGDDFVLLSLLNYRVGSTGELISINSSFDASAAVENTEKIVSMSCSGDNVSILFSTGLSVYSSQLKQKEYFEDAAGAGDVIMRSDGKTIAVFSHSAKVF